MTVKYYSFLYGILYRGKKVWFWNKISNPNVEFKNH